MRKSHKPKATPEDIEAGKRLKSIREKRNIGLAELGLYLGLSYQQVQKYESGLNRMYGATLYRISQFFDVPMEYFYNRELDKLDDIELSERALIDLGAHEFSDIEDSLNRQIARHVDWMQETLELSARSKANRGYRRISQISYKQIMKMGEKSLNRLRAAKSCQK